MDGLAGKRIFITGGTGYIGSLLLRRLKALAEESPEASPASVTVLSRNSGRFAAERPELLWPGLNFVSGDVCRFRFPETAKYDLVIHGGNPSGNPCGETAEREFRETTVAGTAWLFEQLSALSALPERVLLLSSGAVHSVRENPLSPVSHPPTGRNAYAEAKAESEQVFLSAAASRKIPAAIARIYACAGPYLPLEGRFALGQFIHAARERGEIEVRSNGEALRSYLFGDELAEWLLRMVASAPDGSGETTAFDVGSDDCISIRQVAETVQAVFGEQGKTVSIRYDGTFPAGPDYLPDLRAVTQAYGLKPRKSSTQAVRETTEWVLNES